jgi:ADP-ribose pyrophosphatase YjhB (NUDIX family)
MVTERKFLRISPKPGALRMSNIPSGGFCLSAFVIISKKQNPNEVLLGRINPDAPWDHIGALDPPRVEAFKSGWMLPSCHFLFGESPQECVKRILNEQLNLTDQTLDGPLVFSEVYGPESHWDLEFLFQGERDEVKATIAWKDLRFVDTTKLKKEEMSRFHEDILAHVGRWKNT